MEIHTPYYLGGVAEDSYISTDFGYSKHITDGQYGRLHFTLCTSKSWSRKTDPSLRKAVDRTLLILILLLLLFGLLPKILIAVPFVIWGVRRKRDLQKNSLSDALWNTRQKYHPVFNWWIGWYSLSEYAQLLRRSLR